VAAAARLTASCALSPGQLRRHAVDAFDLRAHRRRHIRGGPFGGGEVGLVGHDLQRDEAEAARVASEHRRDAPDAW
jgi:hypothetical protein